MHPVRAIPPELNALRPQQIPFPIWQAAESSPETSAPTPLLESQAPPVPPAPGSAAKPQLQADSVSIDSENIHQPLHQIAPTRLQRFSPAEAATSSENTSPPADSPQAQRPSDSPHWYRSGIPADPLASSAPSAHSARHLASPWPTLPRWHRSARSPRQPSSRLETTRSDQPPSPCRFDPSQPSTSKTFEQICPLVAQAVAQPQPPEHKTPQPHTSRR